MSGRHFGAYGEELPPPCASPQSQDDVDADARFARQLMEDEVFSSAPREGYAYRPRRRPRPTHRSRSSDGDDDDRHPAEEVILATALARSVGEEASPSPADPQPQHEERAWQSPPLDIRLGLGLDHRGGGSGGRPRDNYRRHADPLAVFLDSADGNYPPADPWHPDPLRSYAEAAAAPFSFEQRQRRRQQRESPRPQPRWVRSSRHAGAFSAYSSNPRDVAADAGEPAHHPRFALGGGGHPAVGGYGERHGRPRSAGGHNDVDVDAMSYEDLLALQERVGSVVVGLPRELRDMLPRVEVRVQPDPPDKCAICMEEIEVGEVRRGLPCQDAYHAACIDEWFEQKTTCPVCQVDMRDVLS